MRLIMFTTVSLRRTAGRVALGLSAAGAFVVAAPLAAQAHVTVQPGQTEGGDFSVVAFRVPNERDDASTTRVRVLLPEDQPLGSVQTTAMPGWKIKTATRKLAEPIEMFGAKVDRVVSEVTWTATDGGVRPGQFEDFDLSLGQLPKAGDLVFNAVQTYSNGEQVRWNEVSADGSAEPEHPAPTLHLTAAQSEDSSSAGDEGARAPETTPETRNVSATTDSDSNAVLPTVLSGAALLVALGAAGLAWRRGRS
jgi:periplasmic copper chaperone A